MSNRNKLDLTGQPIYIDLDVHKKSWSVIIHSELFEHITFTQPSEVDKLVKNLQAHFPGASYHSVYESGCSGFWVYDQLQEKGSNGGCRVFRALLIRRGKVEFRPGI